MRVFVYEYTCSSGFLARAPSRSLQAEGWAMLSALLGDLRRVPGIETLTLLHEHCAFPGGGGVYRRVRTEEEATVFRDLARWADYTLIIAPEFDDLLATRSRWVEEVGGRLLGSSPAAVDLTGDKLALSRHLRTHGIPTPESFECTLNERPPISFLPLVWKPRQGAGSQATFLVQCPDHLQTCRDQAQAEGWEGEALVQPFVAGRAASVAFLIGPRSQVALLPVEQHLSEDGRFHYQGGTGPLPADLCERCVRLAQRAIDAVPGLRGYVGVDVVLGDAVDGSRDWVIEINPRLTTSYVGLRALAQTNLAEVLLQVVLGHDVPTLAWRSGIAHFRADGRVTVCP
jgi:predicted ATP-grasp superfamily ATP-dependent carboligase